MRAIKLPYPDPPGRHSWTSLEQEQMRKLGMLVDFPERNISYVFFVEGPKVDIQRCANEVRKSVELQSPGHEPQVLEFRLNQ
jgi:hypothetical protein